MARFTTVTVVGAVFMLLAVVSAEEEEKKECPIKKMMKEHIDACKENLSDEDWDHLKEDEEFENEDIRCFEACIYKRAEFLGEDNKFDIEKMKSTVDEALKDDDNEDKKNGIKATFEKCAGEAEGDGSQCDVSGRFSQCIIKAKKEHKKNKE